MAAAFRAAFTGEDGQTTAPSTATITIPTGQGIVATDVCYISLIVTTTTPTVTTPSGWTLESGPDNISNGRSWLFSKDLVSGDIGATINFVLNAAVKCSLEGIAVSAATRTGAVSGFVADAAGTTATVPTVASVPAGALFVYFSGRRTSSSPVGDTGTPSTYTAPTNGRSATNYGAGTAGLAMEVFYKTIASAGTYGGETSTVTTASTSGSNYAIGVPSGVNQLEGAGTPSAAFNATGDGTNFPVQQGAGTASAAFNATGAGDTFPSGEGTASANSNATGDGLLTTQGTATPSANSNATGDGFADLFGHTGVGSFTSDTSADGTFYDPEKTVLWTTLFGTFLSDLGDPLDGTLIFSPGTAVRVDSTFSHIVRLQTRMVPLVNGSFSVVLPGNEGPNGPYWWWTCEIVRPDTPERRVFRFAFPVGTTIINLADCTVG